jgi:hypothetical protein
MTDSPIPPPGTSTTGRRSPSVQTNLGAINTGDTIMQAQVRLPLPADVPVPKGLHNLPRPATGEFLGRQREIALLEKRFRERTQGAHVITQAVAGLGGVGKSSLALQYAHAHRGDHSVTWWIIAEDAGSITASLAALANRLTLTIDTTPLPDTTLAEWALTWLETHPGWLLIYDNATSPAHLRPHLARLTGGSHLITTRLTEGWHDLRPGPLHLETLTPAAATRLLQRLSGHTGARHKPAARELVEELGCLPLAVVQAAAYIRRTRSTITSYLDRFRAQPGTLLDTPGDGDPHGTTIARTWRITLDTVADRNPLALHVLRVMAWYAPDDIPRTLVRRISADDDPIGLDEALALLADYSMITLTQHTVTMHRLVQAVARTRDPGSSDPHRTQEAIEHSHAVAASALLIAVPDDPKYNVDGWPTWRALLPHINALASHTHPDQDTHAANRVIYEASRFLETKASLPRRSPTLTAP